MLISFIYISAFYAAAVNRMTQFEYFLQIFFFSERLIVFVFIYVGFLFSLSALEIFPLFYLIFLMLAFSSSLLFVVNLVEILVVNASVI